MAYKVLVDVLDEIDTDAGYRPDGTPKSIIEHHKDEITDLAFVDADRIQVYLDLNCIEEEGAKKERESSAESESESEEAAPRKAQGAHK